MKNIRQKLALSAYQKICDVVEFANLNKGETKRKQFASLDEFNSACTILALNYPMREVNNYRFWDIGETEVWLSTEGRKGFILARTN